MAKAIIVLTSHTNIGDTGKQTGFYFNEMATPYWALIDAGHDVTLASIQGGKAEYDPSSVKANVSERPLAVERFINDADAMSKLETTVSIEEVDPSAYEAIFLAGGHGTMFDFPESRALAHAVGTIFDNDGLVSAVCHGPAGLVSAKRSDGRSVVEGMSINSFTDAEERAVGLAAVMPFLLESRLRELGGKFEAVENFKGHAVRDGQLITGQNPASAEMVAALLVEALNERLLTIST